MTHPSLSVLLPAYNEAENLPEVIDEISTVLHDLEIDFEVLVVDDGSNDGSPQVLESLAEKHPELRALLLRRNFGKSAALSAGLPQCRNDVVVLMDADGQDDPAGISALLEKLDGGYDLVTGRRSIRNDRFIKRTTSILYNWVTSRVSGVDGRDFNSGFKVMTRSLASELTLYGELHRYIPVLAEWVGFRSTEVDTNHRERAHGVTKFGSSRFWRGMLDLITVKFLTTYNRRPFHLMGGAGLFASFVGSLLLAWMLVLRVLGETVGDRPALLAGVLLFLAGLQLVTVGLLAELIVFRSGPGRSHDTPAYTELGIDATQEHLNGG